MAINKATLAKEIDGVIEYIYPKTSADIVVYDESNSVAAMIKSLTANKVDKVDNKGLSQNDFTNALKEKLENMQDIGDLNVDERLSGSSKNPIQNKVVTAKLNQLLTYLGVTTDITQWDPTTASSGGGTGVGTGPLAGIGDGSVVGAIKYIMNLINGTSGAVGGKLAELDGLGTTLGDIVVNLYKTKEEEHKLIAYTLTASKWSGNSYSLEAEYPHSKYTIYINKGINVTKEQITAFAQANISSSLESNVLTASGVVPKIDIPVIMEVVKNIKKS